MRIVEHLSNDQGLAETVPPIGELMKVDSECPGCTMDTLWQSRTTGDLYCCFCPAWWTRREPITDQQIQFAHWLASAQQTHNQRLQALSIAASQSMQRQHLANASQLQQMQNMQARQWALNVQPTYLVGSQATDSLFGFVHVEPL